MNSESVPNLCPRCCGPVPADAPQGLCPRCVMARAATPTEAGARSGARLTPPPLAAVAAAFPQFEILELIGVGGMGVVYKARQPKLDRIVALKLLPQSPSVDPAFAERFHREARFLARLTHPYIVSVFDFGESGGFCFLLMEYVDGVNLRQAMQAGRFSPAQALAIVPDICAALQYAHNQGVLHRDIKPENILLDAQGRVKIADFGIAKLVGDPGDPRTDLALTQSGARLGTPHYMAPEQIEQPADVDHRADIYSLGVVFYELLTGELPLGRFAAPSAKTPLDARVDEIVLRALAKERELRQQSAGEMKTQVETVTANPHAPAADPAASAIQAARDAQAAARSAAASWPSNYEYRSPRILFGRPLVHIAFGRDPATGQALVARGIIAIGQKAVGVVAMGGYARGLLAIGGVAIGGVAFGGLALGFFAIAGLALGLVSVGGLSIGLLLALGGGALGLYAGGGLAIGKVAAGGLAIGRLVWDARRHDEAARWILALLQGPQFPIAITSFSIAAGVIPTVIAGWVQWHRHRSQPRPMGAGTGTTISSRRRVWWGLALVPVAIFTALMPFLIYLLQQRVQPYSFNSRAGPTARPEAAWIAADLFPAKGLTNGQVTLQIAQASCKGQVLLLEVVSKTDNPPHWLTIAFSGVAAVTEPEMAPGLKADGILEPKRMGTDGVALGNDEGHLLAGTNIVKGPGNFRFAFVFPDQQSAELATRQLSEEFVNRPLRFPRGLRLFNLTRFVGTDPEGQPLYRTLGGVLYCHTILSSKPPTNEVSNLAALELQYAQNRLAEVKKQAEVGVVAPQGREILDAEVAVAEAEGKLKSDPGLAVEARLRRANLLLAAAQRKNTVGSASTAEVEKARLDEAKARADWEALGDRYTPRLKDGESWPASAGPQNLMRAFTLGTRGEHAGALEALRLALKEATLTPTNRWVFRRGFSAYVFDGRLDQRITALMVHEAAHADTADTLREIQTAGNLIWPADGALELYDVWVDHFINARSDQDTDRVSVPLWLLRAMQPGEARPVTVTHEHKEAGKPAISNIVTGDWLEPR
ncbi:MAG TPA: serine/threonine-protein kinase [Candidatus Limnocylindria bacterium]|nr:serine/threonine-protein kinase [Candidatus Limnocylindria bacterium]